MANDNKNMTPIDAEPDNLSKNPFARIGVYALLIAGSIIFAWPFVWMLGTSFKLDRELFRDAKSAFPDRPVATKVSPYLEPGMYRGIELPGAAGRIPLIQSHLESMDFVWPDGVDAKAMPILAEAVAFRLSEIIPEDTWNLPELAWKDAVLPRIDLDVLTTSLERVRRAVRFSRLAARSWDLEETVLVPGDKVAETWKVEGPGTLVQGIKGSGSAEFHYDFTKGDKVTLSGTFDLKFPAERLYRLQMPLRMDNSWHTIDIKVEKLGKLFQAENMYDLGDDRWGSFLLQEPGPDDQTNKIKTWALLHQVDEGSKYLSDPQKIHMVITIEKNGFWSSWWRKLKRNYRFVLDNIPFWRYVGTSAFLVFLNLIGTVFSCSLVAYAFSRLRWPGRKLGFGIMLATMMIPPQVTMIPFFLIVRYLGWYNTLYPLWVGSFFASAFFVFLLHQFFKGIPKDLEDAAKIDGCGPLRIYWYIMLPLIKPALATVAIFTFLGVWNDFMGPLIYISDQRLYPLSLGLYAFSVESGGNITMMMAGSLLMTLPVVIIFFFAQRYFIQGITMSGIKG